MDESFPNALILRPGRNQTLAHDLHPVFDAAGLKKPDISILSDEFLAEVQHLPQRNLAVELLQKNGFFPTTLIRLCHLLPLPRAKEYKNPLEEISRPVPLIRRNAGSHHPQIPKPHH